MKRGGGKNPQKKKKIQSAGWKKQASRDPKLRISNCPSRMHVLLKVRRSAVRSGRLAPQAAPGLGSRRSRSERREGGAGGGRSPARPPAAGSGGGSGRRARPPSQDSTTGAGGPRSSKAPGGHAAVGATRRSSGSRGRVASRSGSSRRRPRQPAAPPRSVPGCARRGSSPPWRQWRAAERTRGPRPLPPRRVNPFAVPAAPRLAAASEVPTHSPTHRLRPGRSRDRPAPAAWCRRQRSDFLWNRARLESRQKSNHCIQKENLAGGRGGNDGFSG